MRPRTRLRLDRAQSRRFQGWRSHSVRSTFFGCDKIRLTAARLATLQMRLSGAQLSVLSTNSNCQSWSLSSLSTLQTHCWNYKDAVYLLNSTGIMADSGAILLPFRSPESSKCDAQLHALAPASDRPQACGGKRCLPTRACSSPTVVVQLHPRLKQQQLSRLPCRPLFRAFPPAKPPALKPAALPQLP